MNHPIQTLQTLRPALGVEPIYLPLFSDRVAAGFPSPADDYTEGRLSLDEHLIQHKDSTFFVRARGNSMTGAGIFDGDLLVVDRSLNAHDGDIVVAIIDGGFTVKYLSQRGTTVLLKPANAKFKDIEFKDGEELQVWGVVTSSVKKHR
ncbi:MAG: translesion error-prone DNA polymerase V autoproteolytic subunit [Sideroxydans sp.]|nr:translesion error-prone DNA polymerase V autoproteolytic subunit [Sideroxydans sp.]